MSASIVATTLTTPDTTRSYTVTINGADISGDVVQDSLTMEDQGAGTQGTTSFLVANSQLTLSKLADQGLVTIEDHISGNLAFRGFVDSRSPSRLPEWNQIEIVASDHTSLLDNVIPYELRPAGENDQARIGYLWGLYAGSYLQGALTYVQQVSASLPAQQFAGVTIRQALDMIAAQASTTATWYLDRAGMLHYFATETNNAPKNVTSDTPGGGEVAPMDLAIDSDSKAYVSRVYVRGKTDEGSGWVTSDVARAATNDLIRSAFLDAPDSTTSTMRDAIGNAYLARTGAAIKRGTFSVTSADADGWRAGQNVTVRTTHLGSLNAAYRIARVRTTVLGPYNSRPSGLRKYEVEFGSASVASSAGTGPVVGTGIVGDLLDDGGNTLLAAGTSGVVSGLGGAIRRFIMSGVYNGDFALAPPYPAATIVNSYNPLPYWSFVSASGTSISATSVADSAAGSGRVIRFQMDAGGGAGDDAYIEQIIPVNASRTQNWTYAPKVAAAPSTPTSVAVVYVTAQFLKNDGTTTTGSAGTFSYTTTALAALGSAWDLATYAQFNTPADAYYLRVRVGFKRDVAATSVADAVTIQEVSLLVGNTRSLVVDETIPNTWSPTRMRQIAGAFYIESNAQLGTGTSARLLLDGSGSSPVVNLAGNVAALLRFGGASFPGSPTTNDLYYRTDLAGWYYYDGTRWLSTTLYQHGIPSDAALLPYAATTTGHRAAMPPLMGGSDIWIVRSECSFYVLGGGTALDASNKWVGTVTRSVAATTFDTITINSGASATWRQNAANIGALLGAAEYALEVAWTKTGTPGSLYALHALTYRVVAT